jgi:ferritin-like metal-binding protein YciE
MAVETKRDAKLIQYLTEAFGKEKELETALQAHISMTSRRPYKKRLERHLIETRNHARLVERRLKKLGDGGLPSTAAGVASRAIATAKGPFHAIRGTGEAERQLKNAKTEYSEEHEEIATYAAIEVLAEELDDRDTVKVARQIRREEERMAAYLAKQIPVLTRAVAKAEVPAAERSGGRKRRRSSRARRSSPKRSSARTS